MQLGETERSQLALCDAKMPIHFSRNAHETMMHGGHPFMTSSRRGEGVRLRWTHVDGGREVKSHVDVHTEN